MSLKRDNFVRQENSKPSVFAKLMIVRKKKQNYFSEYRKREAKINFDCYFLVFILCICINFIKIFSFDISNRYFYCSVYWLHISSFYRTRKPEKVLISNFLEVFRLYLILSPFLSIPCAQGTTLIKQYSKVSTKTYHWSLKVVLIFLEAKLLLRYQIGSFFAVS